MNLLRTFCRRRKTQTGSAPGVRDDPELGPASSDEAPSAAPEEVVDSRAAEPIQARSGHAAAAGLALWDQHDVVEALLEQAITTAIRRFSEKEQLGLGQRQGVIESVISAVDIADLALGVGEGSVLQESPLRGLLLARSKLLACLASLGVDRVDAGGGAVDLANQEIALVSDTGDKELDARVASVIRAGYRTEKGILRQALVRVYRYNPGMANQKGGLKDGKDQKD